MRSPLNKRLFRELRVEFGKYLVIFILMTLTIGMVSGHQIVRELLCRGSFNKWKYNAHFQES